MKYYLDIRKILSCVTAGMNLEYIMLNETSQTERHTVISLIGVI